MENKQIGDFLKRLRMRSGYTQAEVGMFINVTYKAISRWESGTGTPELGNLLMLSKLYKVTVDDILNCNEDVFAGDELPPAGAESPDETERQREYPPPTIQTDEYSGNGKTIKLSTVLKNPSQKFLTVLFFAFLVMGSAVLTRSADLYYLASEVNSGVENEKVFFNIFFVILIAAVAITELLGGIMPKKLYGILSVVIAALITIDTFVLAAVQLALYGSDDFDHGQSHAFGAMIFALLFAIRLLYVIHDVYDNVKVKKALIWAALGVAVASVVCTIIFDRAISIQSSSGSDSTFYIFRGMIFVSAVTLCFAAAQKFSKWINILTAATMIPAGILCTFMFSGLDDIPFQPYPFESTIWMGLAVCAPVFVTISFLFEGSRLELTATRTAIVLAIGTCVPFAVNSIDVFGVNAVCGLHDLAAAAFVRIAILAAAIITFVRAFRFEQIPEYIRQRRAENEN